MDFDFTEENRGPPARRLCVAMIVLPAIFIFLRFWSRAITHDGKYGIDDWLALMGLLASAANNAMFITAIDAGLGHHMAAISQPQLETMFRMYFVATWLFPLSITLTKLSALAFYLRVFEGNRRFNMAVYITAALSFAYFIFSGCFTFRCKPVRKGWDWDAPGECPSQAAGYVISAIWDAILDIVILVMPVPVLWKLQMQPSRKWLLMGVFLISYSCLVTSLGRLGTVIHENTRLLEDVSYNAISEFEWTVSEAPACLICICLPSCFYLAKRLKDGGVTSMFSSRRLDQGFTRGRHSTQPSEDGFARLAESHSKLSRQSPKLAHCSEESLGHEHVVLRDIEDNCNDKV